MNGLVAEILGMWRTPQGAQYRPFVSKTRSEVQIAVLCNPELSPPFKGI